jgi:hypothetical protein
MLPFVEVRYDLCLCKDERFVLITREGRAVRTKQEMNINPKQCRILLNLLPLSKLLCPKIRFTCNVFSDFSFIAA